MTDDATHRERWEEEVFHGHRWGRHGDRGSAEHRQLRALWDAAQPMSGEARAIVPQILALEICNWRLEESIAALCAAIGTGRPAQMPIGHGASITADRWAQLWGYYAASRYWLTHGRGGGYAELVARFDPSGEIQKHVAEMLGDPDELKELYVERFCLCLERWLQDWLPCDAPLLSGHTAASVALEEEIRKRDSDPQILNAMREDGDGRLQLCNHKALRRYDIILSSIGCGKWRGAMPVRGTDGFERADLLASYLDPLAAWVAGERAGQEDAWTGSSFIARLGEPDATKGFLAALLVSLLRAQELSARQRAERRART